MATLLKTDDYGDPWKGGSIVYKNPSSSDCAGLRNRFQNGIRVLYHIRGKVWYLWDAMKMVHFDVMQGLGLDGSENFISVLYDYDRGIMVLSYRPPEWSEDEAEDFVYNDREFSRLFSPLQDYYMSFEELG